jgi:cell division protein FtsQ
VDLSDPEDVKVLAADSNGEALVHLGSGNYLQRYKTYVTHVQQWRQQFEKLESVDLRYDGQIIVNPDLEGMARQPALTPGATKAAMAAGVKTAAIVNYEKYVTRPAPPPAPKKEAKPNTKAAAKGAVHHPAVGHAPVGHAPAKPAPAKQAALKPKANVAPVAVAKNTATPHPTAPPVKSPAVSPASITPPAAAGNGQKKPSAGIPKETPQN